MALHTQIKVGDVLATSRPRNNFSLRRDAEHTILIAGGIGITPLLSMARTLHLAGHPFTLHYFVTQEQDIIFRQELDSFHADVIYHVNQSPELTRTTLNSILADPAEHQQVYLCGPPPMLSLARELADGAGWPDTRVHFEYFKNTSTRDDSRAFSVELARSGLSVDVPSGTTLLEALRDQNVAVPSSCEQGACGTCKIAIIQGTPDHQDVYLSEQEKARGDCLMSCVSRAKSDSLILDL